MKKPQPSYNSIIDSLINEISSYYNYDIDIKTIVAINKLLDIVNEQYYEDYDFIVTTDYWYWDITNDKDLNFNIVKYYNLSAKKEFQEEHYKKALFFLHLAEFYMVKENKDTEKYQYNLMVIRCNKCYSLLFLNKARQALHGFMHLLKLFNNYESIYSITTPSSTCISSVLIGASFSLLETCKIAEAEQILNFLNKTLDTQPSKNVYDKSLISRALMAKIATMQLDNKTAYKIIKEAITEKFNYQSNYSCRIKEDIEDYLNYHNLENINFDKIITMMFWLHIGRDISKPKQGKDMLFV